MTMNMLKNLKLVIRFFSFLIQNIELLKEKKSGYSPFFSLFKFNYLVKLIQHIYLHKNEYLIIAIN